MTEKLLKNLNRATDLYSELEIHFDWLVRDESWNCTFGDGFYDSTENKYFICCANGKTMDKALELALEKLIDSEKNK